jgi:hypothetical protein
MEQPFSVRCAAYCTTYLFFRHAAQAALLIAWLLERSCVELRDKHGCFGVLR